LLDRPPLVRRGDIVLVTAEGRGLRVTAQGEAKQDGKSGDVIRVRNLTSNRDVVGQVDGERSVRVQF
jgi:flagella basal body P-ring formation protein FlgA